VNSVAVRPAQKSDLPELTRTLGLAFQQDPVMRWLYPDENVRRKKLPGLFDVLTRHHHLAGGGCEVALCGSAMAAAALWDPPGRWRYTNTEQVRAVPGLFRALGPRFLRSFIVNNEMEKNHPEEPHWYLAILGSEPGVRGGGFGHALMQSRLDRVDAEHAPAYLESSNIDNVPYYTRFGFEVTGEITLPDGGPTLWPMWRAAR
jgi:GNAT superfamily N-acetyltransferase